MTQRTKSEAFQRSISEVIPGGVNSPVRSCLAVGGKPLIASHAIKDILYDLDENPYIDYCGSWGALIHGHAHPEIVKVVQEAATRGTSFGVTNAYEEKLARKTIALVPSIEKIRFVSSGTEATMSAVRLARGYTGRDLIVKFHGHYHGHADFFLVQAGSGALDLTGTPASKGIPEEMVKQTISLPFNDLSALELLFNSPSFASRIACVILEPIAGNMGVVPSDTEWLKRLRELTEKTGTLLIFDEVMTGFRVAKGGAQSLYGIKPDLTTLGKIIGGGLPAAAFGGRADVMDCLAPLGSVYQAGTLSGNPLAMAAGLKSLELLDAPGFYEELDRKARLITDHLNDVIREENLNCCIQSQGSMFTIFFGTRRVTTGAQAQKLDKEQFKEFYRMLFDKGIYIPPLQQEALFVSMAHSDDHLIQTRDCMIEFLYSLCYAKT